MNTLFVKIIFLIFTLVIFIYSSSYAKFEITKKNNIIGGIIYLISYGYYFGGYILTNGIPAISSGGTLGMSVMQNTMVAAVGVILALFVFLDLMIARVRRKDPKDKKTDWYFQNDKYDRKYDERADKNQYRNY